MFTLTKKLHETLLSCDDKLFSSKFKRGITPRIKKIESITDKVIYQEIPSSGTRGVAITKQQD